MCPDWCSGFTAVWSMPRNRFTRSGKIIFAGLRSFFARKMVVSRSCMRDFRRTAGRHLQSACGAGHASLWRRFSGRTLGTDSPGVVRFSDHLVRHALVGAGTSEENSSTLRPFRASWREPRRCPGDRRPYGGCHRSSEAYRTSVCIRNSSGLRFSSSSQSDEVIARIRHDGQSCRIARPNLPLHTSWIHPRRSRPLLPILRECEVAIERARADLGEAARLDYGITHAAEWLLDNTYLIRSHIAEIRHNLPDNHNKILPRDCGHELLRCGCAFTISPLI